MTSLARAFVAVHPPEHVVAALEARLAPARSRAPVLRWSPPVQWHVTLRFLGRVDDVDAFVESLRSALEGAAGFSTGLVGAGAFPSPRRGSVLWVGIDAGSSGSGITALATRVEQGCIAAGYGPEPRPFHPHLTVARATRSRDLRPLVDAIGDEPIGAPWTVDAVRLMASDTRPDGAVHEEIVRLPLMS